MLVQTYKTNLVSFSASSQPLYQKCPFIGQLCQKGQIFMSFCQKCTMEIFGFFFSIFGFFFSASSQPICQKCPLKGQLCQKGQIFHVILPKMHYGTLSGILDKGATWEPCLRKACLFKQKRNFWFLCFSQFTASLPKMPL